MDKPVEHWDSETREVPIHVIYELQAGSSSCCFQCLLTIERGSSEQPCAIFFFNLSDTDIFRGQCEYERKIEHGGRIM